MDLLEQIEKLIEAKQSNEDSVVRRTAHIKWLWGFTAFFMTTIMAWVVVGTLWYSKMDRTAKAVEMIYEKIYGNPMP